MDDMAAEKITASNKPITPCGKRVSTKFKKYVIRVGGLFARQCTRYQSLDIRAYSLLFTLQSRFTAAVVLSMSAALPAGSRLPTGYPAK